MRLTPTLVAAVTAGLILAACSREPEEEQRGGRYGRGYETPQYTPPPPPEVTPEPTMEAFTPPPTPGPQIAPANHPYASPVGGKPGFVVSPHAPHSGYVDVRGFSPGMEVRCPYTQKIFLVP